MSATFHLFLSYSRLDNKTPVNAAGEGWITAFKSELERRHQAYSGRELKPFFDTQDIVEGEDWRRRLGDGLRQSRLFLAFLSPNYITSRNCLWEWDEYMRREHSTARGIATDGRSDKKSSRADDNASVARARSPVDRIYK